MKNPKIYEINTWPWLNYLSEKFNTQINLFNIPDEIYAKQMKYFDAVWLMGVWERSPTGRRIALEHPDLLNEYRKALYDFGERDVVGSPYSIYYYQIDNNIGGIDGIKQVRKQLLQEDIKLILDYVPNHVSVDSLWTLEPNIFIQGSLDDLMFHPDDYFSISGKVYAHGKDPNFPSWTDTIQINAFSRDARQKTINTLLNIAELCDGVRCDMAMLLVNKVFGMTWGEKAGSPQEEEFWVEIISAVKNKYPDFLFIAEVYWDMEWELQQQGFDFCYDKRLYERLATGNSDSIREHLSAEQEFQNSLVRFIENHDELRAIQKLGREKSLAAAMIALTLPGARLIYEGQMDGNKIKLPVQLGRRPVEEIDKELLDFYTLLLKIISREEFENGDWMLCEVSTIDSDDNSYNNIISFLWKNEENYKLVVVNFSSLVSRAHVKLDQIKYESDDWVFTDLLTEKSYTYKGKDLSEFGLFVDLPSWKGHIFDIKKKI
ncbi:MAG: alpha-amylase family glycosyl hydrolase [Promethearchaeota archaeon]